MAIPARPHEHVWEIDVQAPVLDTNPPIYTYTCECGAVGQNHWDGGITETERSKRLRAAPAAEGED